MTWLRRKKRAVVLLAVCAVVGVFAAVGIAQALTASISGHTVSYSESITGTGAGEVTVTITGPGGFTDSNVHTGNPCGTFAGSFTLPASALPGTYTVTAASSGQGCDWNDPAPVTVTLAAPPTGGGSNPGGGGGAPAATPVPGNPSFTG